MFKHFCHYQNCEIVAEIRTINGVDFDGRIVNRHDGTCSCWERLDGVFKDDEEMSSLTYDGFTFKRAKFLEKNGVREMTPTFSARPRLSNYISVGAH